MLSGFGKTWLMTGEWTFGPEGGGKTSITTAFNEGFSLTFLCKGKRARVQILRRENALAGYPNISTKSVGPTLGGRAIR